MKLSIVIPAFNEEATIEALLDSVCAQLAKLASISDHEIIVIDDKSQDETLKKIEAYQSQNDKVVIHKMPHNSGKGAAIRQGFQMSTGDIVLVQDADLEYTPEDYPRLIRPIVDEKADVVYGSRFAGGPEVRVLLFWHTVGNKLLTLMSNFFTNLNLTDMETCYKVFRGDVIRSLKLESSRFGIEPEITAKISRIPEIRIYEVPISYYGRTYAEGKKINWKDGVAAFWHIIRFNLLSK
tara:strand:- start:419 stop:1132 length:714 start_codon:yes stop_codon:yes gene_type:complete